MSGVVRRYVIATLGPQTPRHLDLLHGNFTSLPAEERVRFLHALGHDAHQISDAELDFLLRPGDLIAGWRQRLTAAWLAGLGRRTQYRQTLGDLLLASELPFAGQGYCIALALFGESADAEILIAYLDRYLPRTDCHYDQHWAISALLHLDETHRTNHATRFIAPDGLWHRSAFADRDPTEYQHLIATLLEQTGPLDR
jgi:hypothetical protein